MGELHVGSGVRSGAIAGVVLIYLGLVGLLTRFTDLNLVGEAVTLGRVLLLLPPFAAAYLVLRPRIIAGELRSPAPAPAAATGAITGLVSGLVAAAATVFVDGFGVERVREIFIEVSTELIGFLTFDRDLGVGIAILVVLAMVSGAIGGVFRALPPSVRRPVAVALGVTSLMALLQRIVPIVLLELNIESAWLYDPITDGLTWVGALVVLVLTAVLSALWRLRGAAAKEGLRRISEEQPATKIAVSLVVIGLLAVLPLLLGSVISQVLGSVMVFLLLGLGLNIVVGYAGLLDLGYVAFFSFGAYTTALLTGATLNTTVGAAEPAISLDLNFYLAIPLVAILAAGAGLLIGAPVLRLRGDYLAIVTLGLGEIATIMAQSRWAQPFVGGPQGMRGVSDAAIGSYSFRDPQHFYYLALAFVLLAAFVSWRLANSRVGRAWNAMREDEQVADAMGVSTIRYKLLAFAMGGAIGAMGGALFAVQIGSLTPRSFTILVSVTALAVVVLGGLGSLPGVVVGALVLIGLPGFLREFEEYRLLIYGGALVAIMVLRPQGLVPNVRRMRELHEEEVEQDAWVREKEEAAPVAAGGESGP